MSVMAVPCAPPALYRPDDRSAGLEASALRRLLAQMIAPSPGRDRRLEAGDRLISALQRADIDGVRVLAGVVARTAALLDALPFEIPLPRVLVESEHEIGLDWDEDDRRVVSVTVDDSPLIGYASLIGWEPLHGRLDPSTAPSGVPSTLLAALRRLYPH